QVNAATFTLGDVVIDEQPACLPRPGIDRGRLIKQVLRDRTAQKIKLGIANHVRVHAAVRRGGRQPNSSQYLPVLMDRHPTAHRGVVLVELHIVRLGQIPARLDDEALLACTKDIREQLAMDVQVSKGKGGGLHALLLGLRWYWPPGVNRNG